MEDKQWYVVNTYAGHENRVKENLQRRVDSMGISEYMYKILVAEEIEVEYKNLSLYHLKKSNRFYVVSDLVRRKSMLNLQLAIALRF